MKLLFFNKSGCSFAHPFYFPMISYRFMRVISVCATVDRLWFNTYAIVLSEFYTFFLHFTPNFNAICVDAVKPPPQSSPPPPTRFQHSCFGLQCLAVNNPGPWLGEESCELEKWERQEACKAEENTSRPPPDTSVSNRRIIVNFLQMSFEEISADPSVKVYIDPSSYTSGPPVLRLRGGAANEELEETYQAARSKSLKEDVHSKLTKATVFASAALGHLRHVWFGMECDGVMGPGHKDAGLSRWK